MCFGIRKVKVKVKVEFILEQATKAQRDRESRCVAYSFFNLGARQSGWSTPRPDRFTPGKDPVPIVKGFVRPQGRSGPVREISPDIQC
jgi:hypothetical protein